MKDHGTAVKAPCNSHPEAHESKLMTATMAFMSYTPRSGSTARGYEEWLRTVDNPFFSGRPGIAHYSNWKLVHGVGRNPGFTHFDFMLLADGASSLDIFGDPAVQRFTSNWAATWGQAPDGQPADNCQVYLLTTDDMNEVWNSGLTMSLNGEAGRGETWQVVDNLVGQAPFKTLTRQFRTGVDRAGLELRAELIAAPTV